MARHSDARKKLIVTATDLFRRRGYNGTGLTELLDVSGAPKGSFYHHFPGGKEQLAVEVVRYAGRNLAHMITESFEASENFENGFSTLCEKLALLFERSGFEASCPVMAISLDMIPCSEMVREASLAEINDWIDIVTIHVARDNTASEPRNFAKGLLMALEGAWLLARIERSSDPIRSVAKRFQ